MLKKLLPGPLMPTPEAATQLVRAVLRRGEADGRDLLDRLRAAGLSLSSRRLGDLMGNLIDSGLVLARVRRNPAGHRRRGKSRRYALAGAARGVPGDTRSPGGGRVVYPPADS